jgi:hypothetical protein
METARTEMSAGSSTTPSPPTRDAKLFWMAAGILVFTVAAFVLVAIREPVRLTRFTPLVTTHAVLMVAWYTLFVVQSGLVRQGKYATHRTLGLISVALAAGMVVTGIWVALNFYQEFGRRLTLVADVGIFVNFAPLYGFAVWAAIEGRLEVHKRVILVASICMITPALARALDVGGVSRTVTILLYPLILIGLPLVHDRRTTGRLHRASVWAVAFSLLVFAGQVAAFVAIGRSEPVCA